MTEAISTDFIRQQVIADLESGKVEQVQTRFPPEPNGYLHIGHAKAICISFGIARDFGGKCNLRFDDTNPVKEDVEYVESMIEDIRWLGFEPDEIFYASDYFDQLYQWAVQLIEQGDAYVDDLSADEIREYRGTLTEPGRNSPYRERSVAENLDLFERMRAGEFAVGSRTLRAKIDMSSPIINLRDPVMYRILKVDHHRTGDRWSIYPTYDWAHGQSDSIERVTHSLCSLEFTNHRPLYNWFIEQLGIFPSQQIEFARLFLANTVTSKRKLQRLVEEGIVDGWDDPRMPTLAGLRRRGYPPEAIRNFCDMIGISRANSMVELQQLEYAVRDLMNRETPRAMGVLEPLKLIVTNYPEDLTEWFELPDYPQDKSRSERRKVPFTRELIIERSDFAETPPSKWRRLTPGKEVRLLGAYYVTCQAVVKDENGEVIAVHCSYDPESRGGSSPDGRRVKGTIHWVSAEHGLDAQVNMYEVLFNSPVPGDDGDYMDDLNPNSLQILNAIVEPNLGDTTPGDSFQFMRQGYFSVDRRSTRDNLIFNLTVSLREGY